MPNLIETYSLSTGLEIKKPFIMEEYYPIPFEKYIVIHAGGGNGKFPSKIYDYFQDVINAIKPQLDKNEIKIIQIGGKDEPIIHGAEYLCGKTSFHSTAYILSRALLFIGNDSINAHISSGYDIPRVILYGPTSSYNHGPHFGSKEKERLIESHRDGNPPSFSAQENPKTINYIKPEDVVKAVSELTGIEFENEETLFIGKNYHQKILEIIPDMVLDPNSLKDSLITCRMDYLHDEKILAENLNFRKMSVVSSKLIELGLLEKFKQNINNVNFFMTPDNGVDTNYIRRIKKFGITVNLFSESTEPKIISDLRFRFMDIEKVISVSILKKCDLPKIVVDKIDACNDIKVRTSKFLLSKGKIYSGISTQKLGVELKSFIENSFPMTQQLTKSPEFWREQDFYKLYYTSNDTKKRKRL